MHRLALAILLLSTACQEDPVVPETGRWRYMELRVAEDTCDTPHVPSFGDFEITRANEDGFTVDPLDGNPTFECSLSGADYACDDRVFEITNDAVDATVDIRVSASGTLSSPTVTSGDQTLLAECEGADCGIAETVLTTSFPCTRSVEFSANLSD